MGNGLRRSGAVDLRAAEQYVKDCTIEAFLTALLSLHLSPSLLFSLSPYNSPSLFSLFFSRSPDKQVKELVQLLAKNIDAATEICSALKAVVHIKVIIAGIDCCMW